jgi:enterochelin esterase family protein
LAFAAAVAFTVHVSAQDMPLSMLLIDGEEWQVAVEGLGAADGLCTDEQGNLFFCDMKSQPPAIWRMAPNGEKTKMVEGTTCSGLRFGPDGRLYACVGKEKSIVAFELPSGNKTVIATDMQPNDLVVTHKGYIYVTETGKHQVTFINAKTGEKKAADVGITAPNGITLSADQGTLAVSDYRGSNVWTFRIETDGSLSSKGPYMTMRTDVDLKAPAEFGGPPVYKAFCSGDGMSTDEQGRFYVTTSLGLQVFDPTGRMCGVVPKPSEKSMPSVGFGGVKREYLYISCGDKIFRRKVQATGAVFVKPPPVEEPKKK